MYSIDRIEGGYAVLEQDGVLTDVLLSALPEGVREGDLLEQTESGWACRQAETESRRESLAARRRRMLGGTP